MSTISLMPADVRAVFECFTRCSGIAVRLPSCVMQQQAAVFAAHFQIWEMEVCFAWVKARIRAAENGDERNGMSRQSLQWHRMLGEGGDMSLSIFQQRLGLALPWARKNAAWLLPAALPTTPRLPAGKPASQDEDALRARAVEALEKCRREIGA